MTLRGQNSTATKLLKISEVAFRRISITGLVH